jgi:hypothetical protein
LLVARIRILSFFPSQKTKEVGMKHKNISLVVFFLTLFVFQQVQAGSTMPLAENLSQINAA